jgi:hypothetical protein
MCSWYLRLVRFPLARNDFKAAGVPFAAEFSVPFVSLHPSPAVAGCAVASRRRYQQRLYGASPRLDWVAYRIVRNPFPRISPASYQCYHNTGTSRLQLAALLRYTMTPRLGLASRGACIVFHFASP